MTDSTETSSQGLLRVAARRWWVIVLCGILAAAAAGFITSREPKQYTATAQLLFRNDTQPDVTIQNLLGIPATAVAPDPSQQSATDAAFLTLQPIADLTAQTLGHHTTSAQVQSQVSASEIGQSNVFTVSATNPAPDQAARVANAYAASVVAYSQATERRLINSATAAVNRELSKLTRAQHAGPTGQKLTQELRSLGVLSGTQSGQVQVVQPAKVPTSATGARISINIGAGLVLGLLLGLGLALLLDRLDKRVGSPDELGDAYGLPVLGVVPRTRELAVGARKPDQSVYLLDAIPERNGHSPTNGHLVLPAATTEAFRALRARLKYMSPGREARSLLVTSATTNEGKSTIAWQLARVAAMARGRRVLVLEADLRRAGLARTHRLQAAPGLVDVLVGRIPFEAAVQRVDPRTEVPGEPVDSWAWTTDGAFIDFAGLVDPEDASGVGYQTFGAAPPRQGPSWLDVLVAGSRCSNPSDLLESDALNALIRRLSQRYELIVIDAPPCPVVSDIFPLIRSVDGVMIVTSMRHASRDAVDRLRAQLEEMDAPIVGVVVNNAKRTSDTYYYPYGPSKASTAGSRESTDIAAATSDEPSAEAEAQPVDADDTGATRVDSDEDRSRSADTEAEAAAGSPAADDAVEPAVESGNDEGEATLADGEPVDTGDAGDADGELVDTGEADGEPVDTGEAGATESAPEDAESPAPDSEDAGIDSLDRTF